MTTRTHHRWGQLLGLASCPFSVLASTALLAPPLTAVLRAFLLALATAWLALELYMGALRPSPTSIRNPRWVAVTRGLWLCGPWVAWLDYEHHVTAIPLTPTLQAAVIALGWLGLALRVAAIAQVGRAFTYGIGAPIAASLRTRGVYRWIRHPSFTGLLLLTNGLGVFTGSLAAIAILASTIPNVALRIAQEESELERRFGDSYARYRAATWRLVPFIY